MKAVKTFRRILCLFDYQATTGFATVSRHVVQELQRRFGSELYLDIVPINYFGDPGIHQVGTFERLLVPAPEVREKDAFCRYSFLRCLAQGAYDGYFVIQDIGVVIGMLPNLMEIDRMRAKAGQKRLKSLFYFPVDSPPLKQFFNREEDPTVQAFAGEKLGGHFSALPVSRRSLGYLDRLVTYTEYGRREVLAKAPWLKDKLGVIPHGVHPREFYPLSDDGRQAFRKEYFGTNADKVIFINVNRNQFRKDIPTTMIAFSYWRQTEREDAQDEERAEKKGFLYLHMNPEDPMGWDLRQVADQLDLVEGEDYGFPPEAVQNAGSSIDTLRGIYNAADVFVTSTTGEGWGLTVVEAMACGCPVVAPKNTALVEIGDLDGDDRRFWAVDTNGPYCATDDNVIRERVDPGVLAEGMAIVARRGRSHYSIHWSLSYVRKLSWTAIGESWEREFRDVFF